MNILDVLEGNEELLQEFEELVNFARTKHSIHDDDRPCDGECDDCYSGDTEFEFQCQAMEFFRKVSEQMVDSSESENASEHDGSEA